MTAGGALLARLKAVGVDYIFANSGTDFPPVIEGLAEAQSRGIELPQAIVMPHEAAAMGMAHGYYLATARAQAVMAHTNVGLANCAIGAINAAAEQIPVLLFSGRTPTLEKGRLGARTVPIGWGQEMRDQHALVREASKWDYELRFPEQIPQVVDRAMAIATSSPPGPVYVSLPREVLCETASYPGISEPARLAPAIAAPDPVAIARAAALLARAERPVILAQRGAGDEEGFAALARLSEAWAIPVAQWWVVQMAIGHSHPMNIGSDPADFLAEADVILAIDCLAPYSPAAHHPPESCRVIHLGHDPLYARFPVRHFRSDITIQSGVSEGIQALDKAMSGFLPDMTPVIAARRPKVMKYAQARRQQVLERASDTRSGNISKDHVSFCLSRAIKGRQARVLSELGCPLEAMTLDHAGAWFQEPHSGGLGWSFPAALGMQLAEPDRLVVATMGDGSYIFSNPAACHQIAEALSLPVLVLVLNNSEWGAVRESVIGLYPDGHAARANVMPLTSLNPTPDFAAIARASRAWAATVEDSADLPQALEDALAHIGKRQSHALLEIRLRA
ncbi:MAG: thiamine pyrophosphate-requiring protein [Paracoccus sp. (in: a-proteobacteria)]|nr:thiamine pyrophosphate-requiring protein [Paracoccus sp. (in: a-proteobacteria)]